MGRSPCCDKNGLKKGPWTTEEDLKLMEYIQVHGPGSWRTLPKNAGLQRCGKSCRLRWTNYLRPDIKRGRFSFEEEETIIQLHSVLGNKWSAIAARLPGRTDNEIKNYWNTHIRKRLLRMGIDPVTHSPRLDLLDLSSLLNCAAAAHHHHQQQQLNLSSLLGLHTLVANPELLRLATTLMATDNNNNNNDENPEILLQNKLPENQILMNDHAMFQQHQQQQNNVQFQENASFDQTTTTTTTPSSIQGTQEEQFLMNSDFNSNNNGFQEMLMMASNPNLLSPVQHNLYGGGCYDQFFQNNNDVSETSAGFHNNYSTNQNNSPLNSSSTFINSSSSTTEDERESYCSSIMKFEIPASLDFDDFM